MIAKVTTVRTPNFDRLNRVARSVRIEHERLVEDMKKDAIVLASGPYTARDLRDMDHPYARRHGSPLLPLLPININTGRLLRSMRVFRRRTTAGTIWQLQYMIPYSKFVLAPDGTTYMFARGYWVALRDRYQARVERMLRGVRIHANA